MAKTKADNLKNKMRELRARHRLTQAELAKAVSVSRQTIVAVEKGEYNLSVVMALRIAAVFGEPVESVFWLDEENG